MKAQYTPELRRWIDEQLGRGCDPADMIAAMITVGHPADLARRWVEAAANGANAEVDDAIVESNTSRSSAVVPEPLSEALSTGAHSIDAGNHRIDVVISLAKPRIIVFRNLLTDAECDDLVAASRPKLARSETVNRASGGTELNAARTSEGTYFFHDASPLLERINRRIAAVTRWPIENGEPLQILHYGVGAEYKPHYDYFSIEDSGTPSLLTHGGQRVATLIIYLNTPERGGATIFPDVELEVAPIRGSAVFFSYDHPGPGTRTLHGGTPVVAGEKWIATRWMRERVYT